MSQGSRLAARNSWVLLLVAGVLLGAGAALAQSAVPAYIAAAVANPARPDNDRKADAERKPAELMALAGVKPGDRVVELVAGGGYFTRLFSSVVGPSGHVYEVVSDEEAKASAKAGDAAKAIASDKTFPGVSVVNGPFAAFRVPEPADVVWTTQNYHDFHDKAFGPADMAAFNKNIFAMLKPGGVFFVLDHAAAPGSGLRDTETLHRIDPEAVKEEVLAAGFVLDAQSDMFRNPEDPHTQRIFDAAIRGKTDKFIFKFRKP